MKKRRRAVAEINIVPYIDVMLVLLMIFMITAPLLTQGVAVNLPKAAAKNIVPSNQVPLIVTVNQQGEYFLNSAKKPNTPLSKNTLKTALLTAIKKNRHPQDVYVRADASVGYGKVMTAMVLLQKAGAKKVGLLTEPNH